MKDNEAFRIIIAILILILIPLFAIDSINILFKPFHIEKTMETWVATLFLILLLRK